MKNMTTVAAATLLIALALSVPAFGQTQKQDISHFKANAVTAKAMHLRMAMVTIPDDNLPPIPGAVIAVAGGINGDQSRTITMNIVNPQGQYQVLGILSDDAQTQIPLGSWDFENGAATGTTTIPIVEGNLPQILPGMNPIREIEVIRFNGGTVEKLTALWDQSAGLNAQVTGQVNDNGAYTVSLAGDTSDIIAVGVGSYGLAVEIAGGVPGSLSARFSDLYLPGGATTITVCRKSGWCYTDTYKSNTSVNQPSGGKG